jgi:hypothetical protein
MIHYGETIDGLDRLPLAATLGILYRQKRTGTLKALDMGGTSVSYVFWFKRGFPCFSYSRDRFAILGSQFGGARKALLQEVFNESPDNHTNCGSLSGQRLLSQSLVTFDELQQALLSQMTARLLCCAAQADVTFEFDDGMDEFGVVPLSSPLLNPVDVAARSASNCPYERMRTYLLENLDAPMVQLAGSKRIPPAVRAHLSTNFIDSLATPQDLLRILDTPSRMRTLGFLRAFGFVEEVKPLSTPGAARTQETVIETTPVPTDPLTRMVKMVRNNVPHYLLLDLPIDTPRKVLKARYREIAFSIHPDRVSSNQQANSQEVFARLVEAYQTLSKERLRVQYDRTLISGGSWMACGDLQTISRGLSARQTHLHRIGLTTLASEYQRMLSYLPRQVPPTAGGDSAVHLPH